VARFACICAVLVVTGGGVLALAAAPPRLSFSAGAAPSVPAAFDGHRDAETLAAGDLNGDGRSDLALGSFQDEAIWLAFSTDTGRLEIQRAEFPVDGGPSALAAADLNRDGSVDLVVAEAHSSVVSVLVNDGHGAFAPHVDYSTAASPVSVALADLDGDHVPDVATADVDRKAVSVLLNRGDGTLEPKDDYTTAIGPVAVAAGDLDRDGHPDLVTANTSGSVSVLLNRGHGSFRAKADYAAGGAPSSLVLADFDRDGFLDAAVGSPRAPLGRHVTILIGRGDGTFRLRRYFPVRVYASRLAGGDLNGDGSSDLVFSDGGALAVMLNRGDATFQGPLWFGLADTIGAGDFNGDGRLDLVGAWVNDRNGAWSVTVHRNRPGLCNVQDVHGKTLVVATDLLTRAGCTVGQVRHARSKSVRRGRVMSQSPRFPGGVLPAGGQVSLVLSLGRR
jgi:FG-GAP-like repeat/PASTA domain/FG-GAP repeat